MKIYNFDRHTGAYIAPPKDAKPSPMEPGKFLIPAFSTPIPPPNIPAGSAAVFDRLTSLWVVVAVDSAPTTPAPMSFALKSAIWRSDVATHANTVAVANGYDSMDEAVSYANEAAVPKYQIEGRALRAWRSRLWSAFDVLMTRIEMGKEAEPANRDDLLARLPGFTPPDTGAYSISGFLAGKS
jgi:hypothetical protein